MVGHIAYRATWANHNAPFWQRKLWERQFCPLFVVLLATALLFADTAVAEPNRSQHLVWVKYRQTPVNVASRRFEYFDTSRSSFITGAWYDKGNGYMVIGLRETYYHYCRMPKDVWDSFRRAESLGQHYNGFIKGHYDCRLGGVPE
jgi:hypothetical protein